MKRNSVGRVLVFAAIAAWGAASLSGVEVAPDARKVEPLAASTEEPAVAAAQAKIIGGPVPYAAPFPVFIHLSEADSDIPRKVANLGGRASAVLPRLYAGAMPRDAARYVSNWPAVAYIEAGRRTRPLLDASRPATLADTVQAGASGLPAPYDGAGSFVGVIDTGLSRNHRDFYDSGAPTLPRVAQWFPTPAAAGVDTEWHGTHVAGIAAGNGFSSAGLYTGMAPGARLLVSKSTFVTTLIPEEINGILAAAGASPVAVNLSLGTAMGPHDGTSGFEQSVNSAAAGNAASKRIVAVAAGNESGHGEHFRVAALSPFGAVAATVSFEYVSSAVIEFWADGGDRFTVTATMGTDNVTVPSGASGSSPQGRIHVANPGTPSPLNGANLISLSFLPLTGGSATIRLERTRNGGDGTVDGYIDITEGHFTSGTTDSGTITEPANGDAVIAVGSFNTKLSTPSGNFGALGKISSFSSLGPTRDGRRKPDVAAPGAVVYSARSLDAFAGSAVPDTVQSNPDYAVMAGTSMAAPHVTGIAALVWESNPSLTGAQMRARLKKTADLPAGVSAPDNMWGNGKVDALRAVSEPVASITAPVMASPRTTVALSAENSSAAYNPSRFLSYTWSLAARPAGSGAVLASNAASTTFTPDIPGDYTVALSVSQSVPAASAGRDSAVIHVNNPPAAAITGPVSSDNVTAVTFSGASSSDADGQPLTLRWVLVSRPAGSAAQSAAPYFVASGPGVTLAPDAAGLYEIGLRADDGLDNGALAVYAFRSGAGAVQFSVRRPANGCSVARPGAGDPAAAGSALFLLAALAGSLALRRRLRRTGRQA